MSVKRNGEGMGEWYNSDCPPRPVIRYQGGKNRIAPWIISYFPDHKVYCEPFGGSAGVLMQKKRSRTEIYNDLSGDLVNIFKVLRDRKKAEELKRLLYLTPWSYQEYLEAHGHDENETDIEQARKGIIRAFMGQGSGSLHRLRRGFQSRIDKDSADCNQSVAWLTYREAIPAFTERLQGVIIEQRDAARVIEIYDREDILFYVDPPYVLDLWNKSGKKCYVKNMSNKDHESLLEQLCQVKGMVILSGYNSDEYNAILQGWIKREKKTMNQLNQERTECIWISPRAWYGLNSRRCSLLDIGA